VQDVVRPLPVPDILTKPIWDAANEGRLVIQRCQDCQTYYHPPVHTCARCVLSGQFGQLHFAPVTGRGAIYSYTIIHDTRLGNFEKVLPYPVVLVELDEQPGLMLNGNMPTTLIGDLRIGSVVQVIFPDIGSGVRIPDFELVGS